MTEDRSGLTDLPRGWVQTTLGEVQLDRSWSITPKKSPSHMFELYSVPSFNAARPEIVSGDQIGSSKRAVEEDTVLLCRINPRINRVWVVGSYSPWQKIASTEWIPFSKVLEIDPKYLCYFMRAGEFRNYLALRASGVGGSLMRVKASTLAEYPFPVPPLAEQHRIVAKIEELFTQLDAGVAALESARAQLQRYRQAVVKAAVEGDLTREWREVHKGELEPASLLLDRILEERRAKWEARQLEKIKAKGKVPKDDKWKNKYKEPAVPDTTDLPALPEGWVWAALGQVACINYRDPAVRDLPDDLPVTFVPMAAVDAETGTIRESQVRGLGTVRRGYTRFSEGDVLFAKITPCMENGKAAIARGLVNERGFGSTEFHVMRPQSGVAAEWLFYFVRQYRFRMQAKASFAGTAGQLRVPASFLHDYPTPMAPTLEQQRIVAEIEHHLSVEEEMERAVDASLKRAERLRQSILKRAFEGKLVTQDPTDDPASVLLERIRAEKARRETEKKTRKKKRQKETPQQLELM